MTICEKKIVFENVIVVFNYAFWYYPHHIEPLSAHLEFHFEAKKHVLLLKNCVYPFDKVKKYGMEL